EFKVDHRLTCEFIFILNEISLVIFNGHIFHETIEGIVNNWLYFGIKKKNFKEFVANIKELPRTEANRSLITHYGVSEKAKCRFVQGSLDRWIGQYLEIGGKLRDIWFSSDLLDL
ncbi:hypothetical protein RhiirA4_488043, partial [Rhizophagus irregularis]